MSATATKRHDVIVIGSGIAGGMLGTILARHGVDVLLVDGGSHPRFAVGESTTPHSGVLLKLMSKRFDVPELANLAYYENAVANVGRSFGIKKHFGFLMHRDGEEPNPAEANELSAPSKIVDNSHLFRQDSDAYLLHTAIHYGASSRQNFRVADVELEEDHVTVVGVDGTRYEGRYLVDASGFRSVLANKLDLRDKPCRFKHHSRSLFTHMIDLKTSDEVLNMDPSDMPPVPWYQGTMHHIFERGWFWVIPFNNEERSTNPLVSVGLTFDERLYPPDPSLTPEEEFYKHANRFPAVARIFENAKTVRDWVSTPRLQYSSTETVGHRWCLMSHAAGFLDPLFSRGISNTADVVNALAPRLIAAMADDDFSTERFKYVEKLEQGLLDFNDKMVNSSFVSFSDYTLWNGVFRIWAYGGIPGNLRMERAMDKFAETGDDQVFVDMESAPHTGLWWPDNDGYRELLEEMNRLCDLVDEGTMSSADAGEQLMKQVVSADFLAPGFGFEDPGHRFVKPEIASLKAMMAWLRTDAPASMRYLGAGGRPKSA
nr:NAD(P)/FAD-dependent oxidoreductase [Kibdelosporangium sp. MJ126-NF4]CEL19974.1 Monodechloroaminopyrrolnitrin-3-halogenase PrnC [Kibdelosporangium sp. MJ126-NF4]CTQ97198.1 Monodechloroaminopyrrolnitrin-3-halogenase PrnC [Kibdelosporangium sp. MJ126-NF4]